jgi:aspartyl-tRNA(Asn)/glutamyl-tRNA(Gln) amidotransferase subunit A
VSVHAARERVEHSLDLASRNEADHVFILRLDESARRLADAVDVSREVRGGSPLQGLPVTIKDNFDLVGHATTAGSTLLAAATPARCDAAVVTRLRREGMVVLGRTNMTEFAFSGLGLNPHYGTPANPSFVTPDRIPGGSSSGAAVSVGLGIARAAIGTDTGGSIRIPAAFCGLVGFKPTARTISLAGVLPLSPSLDSVGVIARSVGDCVAMFGVIRDAPAPNASQIHARRLRLGIVENYVTQGISPEVDQGMASAIGMLERHGVSLARVTLPELDEIPDMMRVAAFSPVESYAWHVPYIEGGRHSEYDPRVLARICLGAEMPGWAYFNLLAWRQRMIESVAARTAEYDALVWPTVPIVAPTFASLADDATYHTTNALVLRNSTVGNLLDACAITLPCPTSGPPVGITFAALGGRDDHLLAVAQSLSTYLTGGSACP